MSDEVIMLARKYDPKKITFPCIVTEKLDGVAADFCGQQKFGGSLVCNVRSRQDKQILSVDHITDWLAGKLLHKHHVICELYIPGEDFQVISGLTRQHDPAPKLQAFIYDYYVEELEDLAYGARMSLLAKSFKDFMKEMRKPGCPVKIIPGHKCENLAELEKYLKDFRAKNPNAEGVVVRSIYGEHSGYKFGRSLGMMKLKTIETLDLEVHSFEEAKTEDGKPKGMVGRINVIYQPSKGTGKTIIGCGPGKMPHDQRRYVFEHQSEFIGRIAEVSYMPDPAYDALREARFTRWRDDKTKPSME